MSEPVAEWPHIELPDGSSVSLGDALRIGRTSSNQLALDDGLVSRHHASIQRIGDSFWVIDLGSSNGTFVNGQQIIQPSRLNNQDVIRIGNVALVFRQPPESLLARSLAPSTLLSVRVVQQWLLVADIKHFTNLSRSLPAAELSGRVGRWFQATSAAVEAHGCKIHKYLGDGWLGGWSDEGIDLGQIVGAISALDTARSAAGLDFRVALHVGKVTSAAAPTGVRDLVGADLNYVFRMEKIAGGLDAAWLLSADAARRLEGVIGLVSAGCHSVPGFDTVDEFFVPASRRP